MFVWLAFVIGLFPMPRSILAFQLYVFKVEFADSDISTSSHHVSSEKKPLLVRVIRVVTLPLDIGSIIKIEQWKYPGCSFRVLGRARFWSCTPHSKRLFLCILYIVSCGLGNTRGQGPRLSIPPIGSNIFVFVRDVTHVQTCDKSVFFFSIFWVIFETCPNLVMTFVFKVLRNQLLRYILETCPTSDDVRVQSATQSTASVQTWNMSKSCDDVRFQTAIRNRLLRYRLETCPNLWWRACSKCYCFDCFGTYLNMSKPVMTFVFKVLRNRLLRYRLETCPNLVMTFVFKPLYAIDCFGTDLKHVQTCDDVRVQSATQSTASVQTWNMSKPVMTYDLCVQSATQSTASVLETCSKPVVTFMAVSHMSIGIFLGPWSPMLCNLVKRCISCT